MTAPMLLSGPSAVRAARRVRNRPEVPFPWDLAPSNSKPVYQAASIAAPAVATQAIVVQYSVPDGFQFAFKARLNFFSGGGLVIGAGSATWTTDVNTPLGATIAQGWPVEGMQAETWPVGSLVAGPWPVLWYLVFQPLDIVRVKVLTTADIMPGAPNYFISALMGWIWPVD